MTESRGIYAKRGSLLTYFEEAIKKKTNKCMIWPFHIASHGYGVVTVAPRKQRCVHVLACEHAHGPRPSNEYDAAHTCGIRSCFNPRHLRWATRKENMADAKAQRNKGKS